MPLTIRLQDRGQQALSAMRRRSAAHGASCPACGRPVGFGDEPIVVRGMSFHRSCSRYRPPAATA